MEEKRPPRPWTRLRQSLRRQHAQGEACIDDVGRQISGCVRTAADDLRKADLLRVGHTLPEIAERAAVIEVRRMDGMAGCPQIVGKRQESRRLSLGVMEQEYRCHHGTVASLRPAINVASGAL